MDNVTKLVVSNKKLPKNAKSPSRHFRRKMRRQLASAVGIGLVTLSLTALSLSHLASGIEIVTKAASWESWAMAVGFDLGFITMEMAQLNAATDKVAKAIGRFTKPAIVLTLGGSALMNAFSFAFHSSGYMAYGAAAFGISIPTMIYCLTRIGAALYIDCYNKH
jgi:hypothetical protein